MAGPAGHAPPGGIAGSGAESIGQHERQDGEQLTQSWESQGQGIGTLEGAPWVWQSGHAHWFLRMNFPSNGHEYVSSPLEAGIIPTLPSSFPGMSTPGSSPQHRPAGVSPLSLSSEARLQQAQQQVSPTLSPLSPITQVRGRGGVGWG